MIDLKAYTQVNEIIKYMPEELQNKIPEDLRNTIEYNADKDYTFEIEDLDENSILKDTERILSVIYTDYFATEEERQAILAKENSFINKKEIEKQEQYPSDFMAPKLNYDKKNQVQSEDLVVKKEKIYIRILNKIRNILGL